MAKKAASMKPTDLEASWGCSRGGHRDDIEALLLSAEEVLLGKHSDFAKHPMTDIDLLLEETKDCVQSMQKEQRKDKTMKRQSAPQTIKCPQHSLINCTSLHCTACDFKVVDFPGYRWLPNLDYLCFRQRMPSKERLSELLVKDKNIKIVARCCQCSWIPKTAADNLEFAKTWVCAGHIMFI